jgi:hypothetical protein
MYGILRYHIYVIYALIYTTLTHYYGTSLIEIVMHCLEETYRREQYVVHDIQIKEHKAAGFVQIFLLTILLTTAK